MATQDDLFFQDALRRKQAIQQQNANTATQDVTQRPEMQQASDVAAMERAQLSSQTQLTATDMVNQAQADRAAAANATQTNIATLQDQGATTRTGMQTNTQQSIAGMEDRTRRTQLAEDSYLKRRGLTLPVTTYDKDGMRTSTPGVDFSRPASVGIESPLDEEARRRRAAAAGISY